MKYIKFLNVKKTSLKRWIDRYKKMVVSKDIVENLSLVKLLTNM